MTAKLSPAFETMTTVTASAPGKLMLYGEHAVVHGYPCIVTSIDRRISVQVTQTDSGQLTIETQTLDVPFVTEINNILPSERLPKDVRFVATAVRKLIEQSGRRFSGLDIATKRDFHHEYGLGSSSAVTVATVKAISELLGLELSDGDIFTISFDTVLDVQNGIGSGFDVASATYGGTIHYVIGDPAPSQLDNISLPLFVVYSGVKASTTKLVSQVSALKAAQPAVVDYYFNEIATIVDQAFAALTVGDFRRAGSLMTVNQRYLAALGVSSDILNILIATANLNCAWGTKLSGAGGGDCVIGFADAQEMSAIEAAMTVCKQHFVPSLEWLSVPTGVAGVQIESNHDS